MSEIKVDTLTGKTTANDITVTVGASATMSLEQGLAKAWVNFNGTGTIASRDSLGVSGLADNGTGDYTVNLSNSMANVNYAVPSGGGFAYANSGAHDTNVQCYDMTTSLFDLAVGVISGSGATKRDHSLNVAVAHGDLA